MGTRARTGRSGPGVVAAAVLLVVTAAALAGPATAAPSTASRSLFDDDSGTALFGAGSDLAPGTPVAACISVGTARLRWGAVTSISTPRSTALSWATPRWPEAR